jgi:serine/arginine repetitive matrix protein 2
VLRNIRAYDSDRICDADRERLDELEQDRNREREREWNKPNPKLTRSSSGLGLHAQHERSRTTSNPPRPDSSLRRAFAQHSNGSAGSLHARPSSRLSNPSTPERERFSGHSLTRAALQRHHSQPSPRANSPTGSLRSVGSTAEVEPKLEVEQERERNWNARKPKWSEHSGIGQRSQPSTSPLPPTPGPSRHNSLKTASPTQQSSGRPEYARRQSARVVTAPSNMNGRMSPRPPSSPPRPTLSKRTPEPPRAATYPARASSPRPPNSSDKDQNEQSSSPLSRPGWSFPRNRTQLPPLERDDTPERPVLNGHAQRASSPSPSPGHRMNSGREINIPLWSSRTGETSAGNGRTEPETPRKSHRRSTTEVISGGLDPFALPVEPKYAPSDVGHRDFGESLTYSAFSY